MRAAQQKLDDAEYSFRQLLPWPDFGQVDNLRWQLELTEPEGLSTGSERMLKRLDSALERHFNAMESMDDKVIVARERLEAVRELHLQVQLKSIRTEGDLEHAQEAERMAVMEAELDQAEQQEAVREFELSEREYKQAQARGECDEELAALARMADALSMLGMDPWAGTRMAMGGLADAPQEEEQVDMDLSGN